MNTNTRIARRANRASADAANADIVSGEILLGHGHVGDRELQIHGVVDQLGIQLILGKGGYRDRRVLNGRFNLGSRDNDFFQLCLSRQGKRNERSRNRRYQSRTIHHGGLAFVIRIRLATGRQNYITDK